MLLSACLAGEVPRYLTKGMYEEAKDRALEYQEIFGKGNYLSGASGSRNPGSAVGKPEAASKLSQETGIELVATNDVHYTYADDAKAHDILLCIQTGKKLSDENRMRYEGGQYYVKSEEEMAALFPYARQALENTQKIADRCSVEIEFGVTKLPKYDVPEGYTSWEYLQKLCYEGLDQRYQDTVAGAERPAGIRAGYDPAYGICRLFPDRMGFYQICKRPWNRSRTGAWFSSGKYRVLLSGDHNH